MHIINNGYKISVACLILSVSKTSCEITAVQLRKHNLMKSVMLTNSFLMFCIVGMVFVLRTVSLNSVVSFNVTLRVKPK